MPIYEYRCKDCAERFDIAQAFTDDALTVCPSCGGALKKVFGSVGITFKGSGFYKTDSRTAPSSDGGDKSGDKPGEKVSAGKDGSSGLDSSSNGKSESSSNDSGSAGSGERAKTKKDATDTAGSAARSKSSPTSDSSS